MPLVQDEVLAQEVTVQEEFAPWLSWDEVDSGVEAESDDTGEADDAVIDYDIDLDHSIRYSFFGRIIPSPGLRFRTDYQSVNECRSLSATSLQHSRKVFKMLTFLR